MLTIEESFLKFGPILHHELVNLESKVRAVSELPLENLNQLLLLSEVWSNLYREKHEARKSNSALLDIPILLRTLEPSFLAASNRLKQKFSMQIKNGSNLTIQSEISKNVFQALIICLFQSAYFFAGTKGILTSKTIFSKKGIEVSFIAEQMQNKNIKLLTRIKDFDDEESLYPILLLYRKFLKSLVFISKVEIREKIEGALYEGRLIFPTS